MMDQDFLKNRYNYCHDRGIFISKKSGRSLTGTKNKYGYRHIGYRVNGKQVVRRNCRAIYIFHNGEIPKGLEIDHINKDKMDDRIENLRLVTRSQNMSFIKIPKPYMVKSGKHVVLLSKDNELKYHGSFNTKEEADAYILNEKNKIFDNIVDV
jgi:hypothetical protein